MSPTDSPARSSAPEPPRIVVPSSGRRCSAFFAVPGLRSPPENGGCPEQQQNYQQAG